MNLDRLEIEITKTRDGVQDYVQLRSPAAIPVNIVLVADQIVVHDARVAIPGEARPVDLGTIEQDLVKVLLQSNSPLRRIGAGHYGTHRRAAESLAKFLATRRSGWRMAGML